jgi:hypothetical protein
MSSVGTMRVEYSIDRIDSQIHNLKDNTIPNNYHTQISKYKILFGH